ncbi:MAG: hypothetical protein ABJH07_00775 [Sedimentitalea sp.]|uniref:hypothetical protein n=1 Tax=Sedimentitalea sp. TaxID=2048915 RepID=UPI0032648917
MAADGRLGLDAANRFQTILTNTAHLVGYLQIGEPKEQLDAFEKQGKQSGDAGSVAYPMWGRLAERRNER